MLGTSPFFNHLARAEVELEDMDSADTDLAMATVGILPSAGAIL